jgi:hypothetical protein
MKKSKFTEEQIAYSLRQVEGGTPPADVCRQLGVSEADGRGLPQPLFRRHQVFLNSSRWWCSQPALTTHDHVQRSCGREGLAPRGLPAVPS